MTPTVNPDLLSKLYECAFDKYKNITDKAAWFLVLYDAQGNVNAVLSDGEERFNVATGQKDELAKYPQNAALGVKFKK